MLKDNQRFADNPDRSKQLLDAYVKKATLFLNQLLDNHGVHLPVLGKAMEAFTGSVFDLPEETACRAGCAYCCHLRVDVSIPELLVIFYELSAQMTPEGLADLKIKIQDRVATGNILEKGFWHATQTPCPFLDEQHKCLIYAIRPFACRAYHSVDKALCRQGFENRCEIQIPCFPLYRAAADMFASILIRVLADKGFASYPVGFVSGLGLLFKNSALMDQWLRKKDVFQKARL